MSWRMRDRGVPPRADSGSGQVTSPAAREEPFRMSGQEKVCWTSGCSVSLILPFYVVLSCTLLDHYLLRGKGVVWRGGKWELISYVFTSQVTRGSTSKPDEDSALPRDPGL